VKELRALAAPAQGLAAAATEQAVTAERNELMSYIRKERKGSFGKRSSGLSSQGVGARGEQDWGSERPVKHTCSLREEAGNGKRGTWTGEGTMVLKSSCSFRSAY